MKNQKSKMLALSLVMPFIPSFPENLSFDTIFNYCFILMKDSLSIFRPVLSSSPVFPSVYPLNSSQCRPVTVGPGGPSWHLRKHLSRKPRRSGQRRAQRPATKPGACSFVRCHSTCLPNSGPGVESPGRESSTRPRPG